MVRDFLLCHLMCRTMGQKRHAGGQKQRWGWRQGLKRGIQTGIQAGVQTDRDTEGDRDRVLTEIKRGIQAKIQAGIQTDGDIEGDRDGGMQTGYRWGCSGDTDHGETYRDTVRNTDGIQRGIQTEFIGQG